MGVIYLTHNSKIIMSYKDKDGNTIEQELKNFNFSFKKKNIIERIISWFKFRFLKKKLNAKLEFTIQGDLVIGEKNELNSILDFLRKK